MEKQRQKGGITDPSISMWRLPDLSRLYGRGRALPGFCYHRAEEQARLPFAD
ncbi:MAG: hypothetical protein ABSD39_12750 [Terriglobales bacterium]|jgi:hypothetical protein